jgi:hypothetical protein
MSSDGEQSPTVKSTDEARAGGSGQNVRTVLVGSLIAAILAMIVIAAATTH